MEENDSSRQPKPHDEPREPTPPESSEKTESSEDGGEHSIKTTGLVRLFKQVVFASEQGLHVDKTIISPRFYHCFNYSLLPRNGNDIHISVGVTSPSSGDGKTLVASNLAVSLAAANESETILVDLNFWSPRVHSIFGTKPYPGVMEALSGSAIHVFLTQVKHLYVLPAGGIGLGANGDTGRSSDERDSRPRAHRPTIGLEQLVEFRNVLYSLKREFEFVIVDMPSINDPRLPLLLTQQVDGLLVIVNANKTKHTEIETLIRKVNNNRILGFVMNRAPDA